MNNNELKKEISDKIREINEVFKPKIQEIDKENILLQYHIEEKGNGYNMNREYYLKFSTDIGKVDTFYNMIKSEYNRLINHKK